MSEHQRDTAFLRHCIRYDESLCHQELDGRIAQIQRDERSVRRAVWLMAVLAALSVVGLGYALVFLDNFPQDESLFITYFPVNLVSVLATGSLISLLAFACLGMVYRKRLDQRREECRQLVTRLLEARLGRPVAPSLTEEVNEPENIVPRNGGVVSAPNMDRSWAK